MLILQKQEIDKERRIFEYLFALSSLNSKPIRKIQDYEKIWQFEKLAEIEGCKIGNQCGHPSNLFEIHKPTLEHTVLVCPRPYPELVKWSNFKLSKESGITSIQNQKKVEEILKESKDNKNDQQLAEWKEWATKKRQFDRTNHLFAEFNAVYNRTKEEKNDIELVVARGLLKWGGICEGEDIELPLFTTTISISKENETISLKDETKRLKFEHELVEEIPFPKTEEFKNLIEKIENTNFAANLTEELKDLAKHFNPNGRLIEHKNVLYSKNIPVILDQTYVIVRTKNNQIWRKDLKQIIEEIDLNNLEIPNSIQKILGNAPIVKSPQKSFLQSILPEQLYFPISSTGQQKEIVQRVEKSDSVIVQISDNQTKTETVANLVSHYLTEGKRILITTKKDSPLSTLKNSLPKEIRDLCISTLDGESESQTQLEQAMRVLDYRLENTDIQQLKEKIRRNQQQLLQSNQNEKSCIAKLENHAKSEGTPIIYKKQPLYKYDVAKKIVQTNVDYQWIKDELPLIMKFPLNAEEWEEFCSIQNNLTKKDTVLLHTHLPSIHEDLISESSLKTLLEDVKKISDDIGMKYILPIELTSSKKSTLLIMKDIVEEIIATQSIVKDEIYTLFIQDLLLSENRREHWAKILDQIKQFNKRALSLYPELIKQKIALPKKLISELQYDLDIARERIVNGKLPNSLFFLLRGKTTKYLFQTAVLNGRSIKTLADIETLQKYLEYRGVITKLARLFNQNFSEVGIPEIDITVQEFPQLLEEKVTILSKVLDIVELNHTLSIKLQAEELPPGNLFDLDFYLKLKAEIDHTLNYIKFSKWQQSYEQEMDRLNKLINKENIHPIAHGFLIAYQEKDFETWQLLIKELKEQYKVQHQIDKWKKYADKLAVKMPRTVENLKNQFGEVKLDPSHYKDAFTLKKMETWLNEERDINSKAVKKQLQYERKMQKNLIDNIIKDASWVFKIDHMTEKEKTAIKDWKFYTKKIGAGKGRHASKFIEGARESLKNAQSAIPVWIMSIEQVMKNLPITSRKFDAIIMDGSSQTDFSAINILARGEKAILLGDEKDAFSAIEYNRDVIAELIHQYLQDIPNQSLYDGAHSIFKITEQCFAEENRLRIQDARYSIPEHIPFIRNQFPVKPLKLAALEKKCKSSFEVDVLQWIISKGYYVIPQIEVGSYCIDFVIEGVKARLAVECEGKKWRGLEKYEESQLKREALENAGWTFWTVRGKDFYTDQAKTMEGLWAALFKLGIYPIGEEQEEKISHEIALNVEDKPKTKELGLKDIEEPNIQFQFQTKKTFAKSSSKDKVMEELKVKPHARIEAQKQQEREEYTEERKSQQEKNESTELQIQIETKEQTVENLSQKMDSSVKPNLQQKNPEKQEEIIRPEENKRLEINTKQEEVEEQILEIKEQSAIVEQPEQTNVKIEEKIIAEEKSEIKKQHILQESAAESDKSPEEQILKKPLIIDEMSKLPQVIYTNKEKNESKVFSISKLNDIPPELIQNVVINGKTSIAQFLQDLGFEIVDYSLQDGSLWVVANEEIQPFMEKLKAYDISFHYLSQGNPSTKGNPAWYTKIVE